MQVSVVRTVPATRDYCRAFIRAWGLLYPEPPAKSQCGVLYAQWMVETGGKHCWNWNIGNVKVTPAQVAADVPWIDLPGTWEIVGGQRVTLKEGDPGRRFRAFASLDDAMREHLAFLRNKQYAPSWPFVEAGDPDGFARALKRQGYYTASADDYARIMRGAHAQFMRSAAFDDATEDVRAAREATTEPAMRVPDFDVVHASPFQEPDDDPPPETA